MYHSVEIQLLMYRMIEEGIEKDETEEKGQERLKNKFPWIVKSLQMGTRDHFLLLLLLRKK